ncbi:MAG: OsmC family protein [Myxococcales bacterium]|nr:OsmC family protein [Myxococcales bacterium]
MRSEKFEFEGPEGHRLSARLERPDGAPRATALIAHCFTCSKDSLASTRIARRLAQRGFATLRFDFTGLGGSEGEFANTSFSSNLEDLVAAAEQLRARVGEALPLLLVGHSLGGAAVLATAARVDEVSAVATIGAPCDPAHVTALFRDQVPEINARGEAEVSLGGRTFRIRKQFLEDLAEQRMRDAIGALRRPLLVLHAPRDQTVGIDHATRIFTAAKHPKSFISLDDADHLLTRPTDARYVAEVLSAWASRYLTGADATSAEPPPPPGEVVVRETGVGQFQHEVRVGRHRLTADEPTDVGGDDAGPGPYDFLLTALGACTSMTMRMYARRKGWPVERLRVTLRHAKVHARDCEDCDAAAKQRAAGAKIDLIERELEITGALDDDQRARMLEIADKCPVHRTLRGEIVIKTSERR